GFGTTEGATYWPALSINPTDVLPPAMSFTLHVTVFGAPVTVAVKVRVRVVRTVAEDGLTLTVTPFWIAAPEFGSIRSTVASTASKFEPSNWPNVRRLSSFHRGSGAPEMNHAEPLSARMIPYFFMARRITCTSDGYGV